MFDQFKNKLMKTKHGRNHRTANAPKRNYGPHSQPYLAIGTENRIGRRHLRYQDRKEEKAKNRSRSPGDPKVRKKRESSCHPIL